MRPDAMRLAASVVALLSAMAACVPASEPRPPAGAAGVRLEPSAAATGEPFRVGAWTVTIKKLVIRADVSASVRDEERYGYASDTYLVDATRPAELIAPGIVVGAAWVDVRLEGVWFHTRSRPGIDHVALPGVTVEDQQRFEDIAVPSVDDPDMLGSGAAALLVLEAERDGAALRLDARLASNRSSRPCSPEPRETSRYDPFRARERTVDVRANDVVFARAEVRPEDAFACVDFDRVADADANHDGVVDNAELLAAPGVEHEPNLLAAISAWFVGTLFHWPRP